MKKICVVTGTRADYGALSRLMRVIKDDADLKLQVIVTGMHLSPLFGLTYQLIEEDGFYIDKKIELPLSDDSDVGVTKATGTGIIGFANAFAKLSPDIVIIYGDRFEMFSAATAAMLARMPIAHLHGGESTIGAIDDSIRHAITKMAYLHFAAAEPYRQRIIQMGESPERVFCVGTPCLDDIEEMPLLNLSQVEELLGLSLSKPTFLVTYHPVTVEGRTSENHMQNLLNVLDRFAKAKVIFTGVNADADNRAIHNLIENYVGQNRERARYFVSLGQLRYLSVMKYSDVVIGNSSSGIVETPALGKASVNIGERQKGRLMASSIINCPSDTLAICGAIEKALSDSFQNGLKSIDRPYKGGNACKRIKDIIKDYKIGTIKKEFYEYKDWNRAL